MLTTLTSRPTTIVESVMPVCAHLLGNLLKARLRVRRAAVGNEHHMLALRAVKRLERVAGQTQRPGESRQLVGVGGFDAVDRVQHRLLVPIAVISTSICASSENVMTPA